MIRCTEKEFGRCGEGAGKGEKGIWRVGKWEKGVGNVVGKRRGNGIGKVRGEHVGTGKIWRGGLWIGILRVVVGVWKVGRRCGKWGEAGRRGCGWVSKVAMDCNWCSGVHFKGHR
jgi:hypothetical protein